MRNSCCPNNTISAQTHTNRPHPSEPDQSRESNTPYTSKITQSPERRERADHLTARTKNRFSAVDRRASEAFYRRNIMLCFGPCVQRPLRAPVTGLRAALLGYCSYSPSPASAGIPSSWRTPGLQLYIPGPWTAIATHTLTDDKYCTIFRGRRAQGG